MCHVLIDAFSPNPKYGSVPFPENPRAHDTLKWYSYLRATLNAKVELYFASTFPKSKNTISNMMDKVCEKC